ncbi:Tyrosine-protein kinase Btk29A [Portunus trituberculatus]|uniref:Tyrosine-protein kinase Btk29A n=1 Tax=Portunus trituberculatus TaxID=210409 RepID=A0A5B7EE78_PORTR|nr:Tyrosine-protein kinase Btk29A [Portunus trituberculatus]
MAGRNEEVLKEAFMTKRSQNKRSFTPTNWKERWFVLSPENLIYFDGDRQLPLINEARVMVLLNKGVWFDIWRCYPEWVLFLTSDQSQDSNPVLLLEDPSAFIFNEMIWYGDRWLQMCLEESQWKEEEEGEEEMIR